MKLYKLSHQAMGAIFVVLLLVGCCPPAVTSTPIPPSATPSPVLPTITPTPTRRVPAVDATTLRHKVIFGYQGWFSCPGDGSGMGWSHWFDNTIDPSKEPEKIRVDIWPDTSELSPTEWCDTGLKLPDGRPFVAFSSFRQETVVRHFQWMEEYGIDGVEVQRFTPLANDSQNYRNFIDQVLINARVGAEIHGRVFYIQFAGAEADAPERFQNDWHHIVDDLRITESPQYLHHNGLPVVGIFISPTTEYEPEEALELIRFFKENEDPRYRATVKGGVVWDWLHADDDWAEVYRSLDVISPWLGWGMSDEENSWYRDNVIVPGIAETKALGSDFMPVIFPGFTWANLTARRPAEFPEADPYNKFPRDGGRFFWRQVYKAISAGADMLYVAMFDEVDEGTAMFKLATTSMDFPEELTLVPLNVDGYDLPSDWYLLLGGETGKALRGEIPLSMDLPLNFPP